MYKTSDNIDQIATALASAQRLMEGASKDTINPFYKSNYADLASVWLAIREPLGAHGLAVVQLPSADGQKVTITTILTHSSGQYISSELTMTAKEDSPQAVGSCITYARRYALQSVAGVAPEDDDGEGAQGRGFVRKPQSTAPIKHAPTDDLGKTIHTAFENMLKKFMAANRPADFKQVLGNYGYVEISEIPADRDIASNMMNDLKALLPKAS